jgi:cytochrome c oxidase assembly protein subunit 15
MNSNRILWFRRLALFGALLAATVVVLGAWVRLTDAGLGCPDWPGCYGHLYPQMDHGFSKAIHEMTHRYFASTLGFVCLLVMGFAFWNRKDPKQPKAAPALLFLIVCFQGALGALTVTKLLKPFIVTSHLLGGLTTLAILWWLSLEPKAQERSAAEVSLRPFALAGLVVLALQIFLGGWTSSNYAAVACPDLPTCQGSYWPHMDFRDAFILFRGLDIDYTGGVLSNPSRIAIHVTHRLGAIATGLTLFVLGITAWLKATDRRTRLAGLLVAAAVIFQICIGMFMVRLGMPLPMATFHNAGAALLLICLITLLRTLWPARLVSVLP